MIERWDPALHWDLLGSWYRARGIADSAGDPFCKPAVGFVADGVAMGFLFQTDAVKLAYLDAFAADPAAAPAARADALRKVLRALVEAARRLGLHMLMAASSAPTLVELASSEGFTVRPGFSFTHLRLREDHHA